MKECANCNQALEIDGPQKANTSRESSVDGVDSRCETTFMRGVPGSPILTLYRPC